MEGYMSFLKKTLGIIALVLSLSFSGVTNTRAQTLEIVFVSSLWGSAIGGVSGIAVWALQDEDNEDKFFTKYAIKGMALGLFAGMGVGIFEARSDDGIFMSNKVPRGILHLDVDSSILAIEPAKIIPIRNLDFSNNSEEWRLNLITASF
tara:strand:+ start:619 stop:1065 length:447 start_codon:yes stop_codon:yes gene_type:complete